MRHGLACFCFRGVGALGSSLRVRGPFPRRLLIFPERNKIAPRSFGIENAILCRRENITTFSPLLYAEHDHCFGA